MSQTLRQVHHKSEDGVHTDLYANDETNDLWVRLPNGKLTMLLWDELQLLPDYTMLGEVMMHYPEQQHGYVRVAWHPV